MKYLIIILFFLPEILAAQKAVPVYINAGTLTRRDTANGLVATSPLALTSGGNSHVDTITCTGCGSGGSGTVTGSGTATRISFWRSSTALSSGANINVDSTNSRIGYGTTAPTHTITLDSTAARATTSGNTSTGGGGISFYYTTNQTTDYKRAHIYATNNGLSIMANQYNGAATFFPLFLNHANTFVNSAGQLNSVGVNSSSTITGSADFTTTGANNFFRSNNYIAIANNTQMRFQVVGQNQSSGDYNGVVIDALTSQAETGTSSFSVFKIAYNPTSTGSGKYSYINLGAATSITANFVTGWRVFTNNHTVIGDSTDNGAFLRVNGSTAFKYNSTATGITLDGTYGTVEVTATGQTITLPTAVGITGRFYTIKLTASGTATVNTTSSQTIDGSTTYSLSAQYKYVTVQSNGSNWIIMANN